MLDETTFRRHCDTAMEALKQRLIAEEEEGGFEVEEQNGVLNILFDEPPGKICHNPQHSTAPDLDLRAFDQLQAGLVRERRIASFC